MPARFQDGPEREAGRKAGRGTSRPPTPGGAHDGTHNAAPGGVDEELVGTVDRLRFSNPDTFWTVASVRADDYAQPVTAVGTLPGLVEGMRVRLHGAWQDDRKWGRQFRAERYMELVPATAEGLEGYLASGFIGGIGPALAGRIVEHLGPQALDIIAQDPARLREIPGLGPKRIQTITTTMRQRRGAQEALVFLMGLRIPPGLANRIYKTYRDSTVAVVRSNPYRLAEEVRGVGFLKADQVARGLQIGPDHPARIRAGVYHTLLEARGEGHCFLPRTALVEAAAVLLGNDVGEVDPAVTDLVTAGKAVLEDLPHDPLERAVYLPALHEAERDLAHRLRRLLDTPRALAGSDKSARLARLASTLGLTLAPAQEAALRLALERGTAIITGGPGTGKTTIIRALLLASDAPAHRVALAAPTGRAAKRMAEATAREASTIHRLLKFSPQEGVFQHDEDTPLEVDLVIIDEASMLDVRLFDALARAVPPDASLVLVGDADQLPPVGPGAPFTDLIASGVIPVGRLQRIYRQGAGSAIIEAAHQIRAGVAPPVTPKGTPIQDFYFIERADPEDLRATIEDVVAHRIPDAFGYDPVDDIQVLAPMKSGPVGVHILNESLQRLLNPAADGPGGAHEVVVGKQRFRVGDKVMQIRNDYDRNVFNGDLGRVISTNPKDRKLIVNVDGRAVPYDSADLDDLVLAYAVSVHKSQGSEYPAVVMPVTTHHYKMLQRNLLYTGVTRGKRLVVLVGTRRAAEIAVRNADQSRRNTLLAHRLAHGEPPAPALGGRRP